MYDSSRVGIWSSTTFAAILLAIPVSCLWSVMVAGLSVALSNSNVRKSHTDEAVSCRL